MSKVLKVLSEWLGEWGHVQLLFYIRQAVGKEKCIVKHFQCQYEDELDREMNAFFEISGSSQRVQGLPSAFRRVDSI